MKYILFFITLIVTCNAGWAQEKDGTIRDSRLKAMRDENGLVEINSVSEVQSYYSRAIKCLDNKDSVPIAFNILQRIYYYDSVSQLSVRCMRMLDSIHTDQPMRIRQQLLGTWRWLASGSNWGVSDTPDKCKCEKQIVFDKERLHFIEQGRETAVYSYFIVPASDYFHFASEKPRWELHYVIDIHGLNEQWRVDVRDGSIGGAGGFFKNTTTGLSVDRQFNCVCGCPEEVYEKIIQY